MICQWNKLLSVLPQWLRTELDIQAEETCQEIRLRLDQNPQLVHSGGLRQLKGTVNQADLTHVINMASRYSPWAASTIAEGYVTAPGGHRIGICGEAVMKNGVFSGVRNVYSLCIRVARDITGCAAGLSGSGGSLLLIGAPGWGKTTLLRDLIRQRSRAGQQLAVVDEREELFPMGFSRGRGVDVLSGCPKSQGILMLLKTMGPETIAVDEITSEEDCSALLGAVGCGVQLLATAHASSLEDFRTRTVYRPLITHRIFDTIVILHQDKSWHLERSNGWKENGSVRC